MPFESLFTRIKFLDGLRVTTVCFSECHGAAITAQGHVVIWGSNIYSQRGKLHVSQNKPNLLQLPGLSKAQVNNYSGSHFNNFTYSCAESYDTQNQRKTFFFLNRTYFEIKIQSTCWNIFIFIFDRFLSKTKNKNERKHFSPILCDNWCYTDFHAIYYH